MSPVRGMTADWPRVLFSDYQIRNVLDVGANVGGFIDLWLEHGATTVHAIEPEPTTYAGLEARYRDDPRVTTHKLGVSDAEGELVGVNVYNCWTLRPEASKQLDRAIEFVGKPPFDVELTTIDRFCGLHHFVPDFIKIDVDGYDARALRGARAILAEFRPVLMLEVSYLPFFIGDCCECMIRGLFDLGYTLASLADFGKVYNDAREFMRTFPWDTSYDVICEPRR